MPQREVQVGLISDTHGTLRPQAVEALRGSDYIIHAGDIGAPQILHELAQLAPVTAVRGNNDKGVWPVGETAVLQIGDFLIYVLHDLAELNLDPAAAGFHVVVSGHSHRPSCDARQGVLYINPGSAGPRRFKLPVCVGRLIISGTEVKSQLIDLPV